MPKSCKKEGRVEGNMAMEPLTPKGLCKEDKKKKCMWVRQEASDTPKLKSRLPRSVEI